ncbi:protein disulfide-isomerase-like [Photinus pyralis]|uniref:protein disulfide-isomerase-like n=1 Tax=Photinus pyralis TaxID=7054 RepID=UPI0012670A8A|nr:protein disulfide-isomerase-like [Photinus pyralis]
MWKLYVCLFATIVNSGLCGELEDEILVLNENNFDQTISGNEYVFVKFYASWCVHSRNMASEYAKAAKEASKLQMPIKFAEVESKNKDLIKRNNVTRYPTLLLFRRNTPITYYGGDNRTCEAFISWLKDQARPAVKQLNTTEEAEALIENEDVIIGFFKNQSSTTFKKFVQIADHFATPTFTITDNEETFTRFNAMSSSIVGFLEGNLEGYFFKEELNLDNMEEFVNSLIYE